MPIFPVVYAVADAQLVFDMFLTHEPVDIDGEIEEEVIVSTVKEPLHGSQLGEGLVIGIAEEVEGRVFLHGFRDEIHFVIYARLPLSSTITFEPGTHGIT